MATQVSLARTRVKLNGTNIEGSPHDVTGYADDNEVITLPTITLFEVATGADGAILPQGSAMRGGEFSLKLLPTARSVAWLFTQFTRILNGNIVNWSGTIDYTDIGLKVTLSNGVMLEGPTGVSLGKQSTSALEWKWHFQAIVPDASILRISNAPTLSEPVPVQV